MLQLQRQQCVFTSGRRKGLFIETEEIVTEKERSGKMKGKIKERQMVNVFKELY